MIEYTAYFINDAGIIAGVQSIYSHTDEEALRVARLRLVETRFPNIEVWDHRQCVGIVDLE